MKALSWLVFIGCLWALHRVLDGELGWPWLAVGVVAYVFVLGLRGEVERQRAMPLDRARLYDARTEDREQPGQ